MWQALSIPFPDHFPSDSGIFQETGGLFGETSDKAEHHVTQATQACFSRLCPQLSMWPLQLLSSAKSKYLPALSLKERFFHTCSARVPMPAHAQRRQMFMATFYLLFTIHFFIFII